MNVTTTGQQYAASATGRRIVSLRDTSRRLAADFPGWGHPNYADHLLPAVAGLSGTVTSVESHGSSPHTRYTVRFDDGSRMAGAVPGEQFAWA